MKANNQAEQVYEFLRKQLLSGHYDPGQRLVEQAVGEAAGGNRGDVRQALSRLLAEGLVEKGKRGGYFTSTFTREDFEETQEVRQIIEIAAVRLAVFRADEADLQELEETARHMLLLARNEYYLGVSEADLRFHEILVRAAHNSRLLALYKRANIPISGVQYLLRERMRQRDRLVSDAGDHVRIAQLLREGGLDEIIGLLKKSENYD